MSLLIKNTTIINADKTINELQDILIENNKIIKIAEKIDVDVDVDRIIDAEGLYVMPGIIDAHTHLRDPGQEYKEDIISGTKAAAKGGITSVACMPNTYPVADDKAVISYIVNKAKEEGYVNVYPIGAITKGQKGVELAEIGEMKKAGAVGISDDGRPVDNSAIMKKAMIYASSFNMPVISHCEDIQLAENGSMNEGIVSNELGLRGISTVVESAMVARDILLSEFTEIPIHIAHISCKQSANLIRNAKKRGVKVTCETCPHYFTLTEEACYDYNTNAKMNPPLRTQKDLEAVIEAIKDGTVDMIVTDHAPHHIDEKNIEFESAMNGIIGFETILPLTVTYLLKNDIISLNKMVELLSYNPSKLLNLENKGRIEVGYDADITIIDINKKYIVNKEDMVSKSKNTPFDGFEVYGKVKYTIVNGKVI